MPALTETDKKSTQSQTLDSNLRTKALVPAAKVMHAEAVPGGTDNDGDSWREHHSDGFSANQEVIRQLRARLDVFGNFIDEDGFTNATTDQAAAGYAYEARDGQVAPNQSLAVVAGNQVTTVASAPSSGIVLYIRVPAGINPETVRIDHRRGTSLVASYPRASDDWERTTAFTGRSPHYDYYRLVDDNSGSTISISGVQAGDTFLMRIHGHDSAVAPVQTVVVVSDEDDALPDADDHPDTRLILWRGQFYRRASGLANVAARFRVGMGLVANGVWPGSYGQYLLNPDGRFDVINHRPSNNEMIFDVRQSAYRTAKGSNEASGDQLSITLATEEDTPVIQTITFTFDEVLQEAGGALVRFKATSATTVLTVENVGKVVNVTVRLGGNVIFASTATHAGWVEVDLAQAQINAQAIQALEDQLADQGAPVDPHTDARLAGLEAKTADVNFDDQQNWVSNPNTPIDGKRPYGGWAWIARGGNAANYASSDFEAYNTVGSHGFNGAGSGLIWVLPNNINWSRVRLVVRRADGTIRTAVTGQSLRNAPASVVVANLPDAPPDVTVRWSASSDAHPYAVSNIEPTDTVALEVLDEAHIPVWEGELGDGVVTEDSLSAEVVAHIDRHENAQGRVEIATDPDPVLVGGPSPVRTDEAIPQDAALAHAIRIGNLSGLHRALQVRMDVDFFLRRSAQANNTGWLNAVEVYIEIAGKLATQTRLVRQALTLANFLSQFNSAGADTYSSSADYTHNVNMNLDVSEWDIDEDDHVQIRVIAFGTVGNAHVRVAFRNTAIIYDELASSVRQVPEFPPEGAREGNALRFAGNAIGWHPTLREDEELASRRSLTGGWTIPTVNRLGANNSIGQSGTSLHIGAHSALLSGAYGVIVSVEQALGTMKVFIPWSAFRTGSGTYVTGGGHGGQGIPIGYWNANNNSEIVATADWAEENGRFELTLAGPTRSGSAIIRVWSAR